MVQEKTRESTWTAAEVNQSSQRRVIPEYSLEGWHFKLTQYFGTCTELTLLEKDPECWEEFRGRRRDLTEDGMFGWHL